MSHPLAYQLPDLPRWVELRDCLLGDSHTIFALEEAPELALVVHDWASEMVFVLGTPPGEAVRAAVEQGVDGGLVAPPEAAAWLSATLPALRPGRIIVHHLPGLDLLPDDPAGMVHFLDPATIADLAIPADLRREFAHVARHTPIAATTVAGGPVAFCYPSACTETLWDVSIDTLEEHRRQGYGGLCAAFMTRHMHRQGKLPVWQALEANPASWRLAQRLGFVAIDELAFFEPV